MNKRPATLWQALERFPPVQVRILAKKRGSGLRDLGLSDADIAITSGLPLSRVRELARMTDWLDVTVREIFAFTIACGFDPACPEDRQRVRSYEYLAKKRGRPVCQYIKKSPRFESEYLPLLQIIRAQKQISTSRTSVAAR
jgi:hypothetical protein